MPTTWNSSPGDGRAAPGTVIGGRYSLRTAIGTGGMGTVWRASDNLLRRDVAVKEVVCPPGMAASDRDAMYERTMREARAAAALAHPSVVQVYDVVTEGGRPWIVMELLDARSLADMVIEGGPLAPRTVAKIGVALLGALEVAHAAGVLHRDVKPANVLICQDGRCVLTDFGVARMPSDVQLTTPGMVLGSPHFISPERAMGHAFGPPSDLFSLGVTLFTAVEGRPPFDKGDPLATMHAVVEEPPAPMQLAGPLVDVLGGLLIKDPSRRWDVPRARVTLRDLLAGDLAQQPSAPSYTDPWSVMPTPQGQWTDPTAVAPTSPPVAGKPPKQVGGRALLATGDMPQFGAGNLPSGPPMSGNMAGAMQATGAMPQLPTGAMPPVKRSSGSLVDKFRGLPKGARIGLAAGLAAVVLIGTVAAASSLFGGSGTPEAGSTSPGPKTSASAPASPQAQPVVYTGKGYKITFPIGWKKGSGIANGIEYRDPKVTNRYVRVQVYSGKNVDSAVDSKVKDLQRTSTCETYEQLGITPTTLAAQDGSQLEYLCTPKGQDQRHGTYTVITADGKTYRIQTSTEASDWDEAKPVFEEIAQTFALV
ncbi:serine/threonine protein kinase [Hamadaea flava]|uniref:non-specific serine/threonine protein kinase n=1 Tax=Hamadaea flava TaxID=1742688 RepID=A0ABV8LJ65_9ACTN|nr:protein kinase [Hamadaea flava]MCP2325482.1 serine/threonine protein kinase [Hamadaea flava]